MTIAVDFDGVIHAYSKGWRDGTIYDPPMPGALESLRTLMDQDAVFIFTTRDVSQVASWLLEHGFSVRVGYDGPFWNERGRLLVTNRKLAATAYLDDRAVRFETWEQALADLDRLKEPGPVNPPGSIREQLPADVLAVARPHLPGYASTACQTGHALAAAIADQHGDVNELDAWRKRMHTRCRTNHKFTGQPCTCWCHQPDNEEN